jgi:hypothetical protein
MAKQGHLRGIRTMTAYYCIPLNSRAGRRVSFNYAEMTSGDHDIRVGARQKRGNSLSALP